MNTTAVFCFAVLPLVAPLASAETRGRSTRISDPSRRGQRRRDPRDRRNGGERPQVAQGGRRSGPGTRLQSTLLLSASLSQRARGSDFRRSPGTGSCFRSRVARCITALPRRPLHADRPRRPASCLRKAARESAHRPMDPRRIDVQSWAKCSRQVPFGRHESESTAPNVRIAAVRLCGIQTAGVARLRQSGV